MTTDDWRDPGLAARQAAALELVASAVGLSADERTAAAAMLADGDAGPAALGDRYEAFCRTFPLPFERRAQAVASHDDALAAQIDGWFHLRWVAQHTTGPSGETGSGALARLVSAMALPLTDLPELVGDHLGGSDPVTGALVVATVERLTWHVEPGFGLVLSGQCSHPVVDVALQAMVDTVGERLLGLAGRGIGLRARADLTATERDGQVSYVSPGVRFMLAEDRIRSLLMGENLYRRSGLALRELYQNAVDACRHRQARLDFLSRTTGEPVEEWCPAVGFVQGCDDDGQFIECVDNGIGMGLTEIRGAFCQAGVRSADLPEYLAELADFAELDPPVKLWTNSRFGIGALSYFMLADQITVTTTRTHRDGTLGHTLRVHIPAAGAYFRIQDLGPGTTPGTTVRLRLRAGVDQSCVDELRSVVVVAPYELTADDHVHQVQHRWAPGVLDTTSTALRTSHETPRVAAPGSDGTTRVWFVSHYEDGGVLADGLWAGQAKDCVVVNLEAEHAPLLTVDRTEMISHDAAAVSALLLDAVPALVNSGDNLLRPYWLLQLANTEPEVADALYQARSAAGPWPYQPEVAQHWTGTVDLARTGVAADDDNAFADVTRTGVRQPKTAVEGWHLSALLAAGAVPHLGIDVTHWRVQPALPSDSVLLTSHLDVDLGPACGDYRGYLAGPPSAPHIACATVQMRRPATQVVSRLRQLGYDVADTPEPDELDARLLDVLRHHSLEDTPARSLDENTPVGSLDVALLAARLQVSPQLVVQRAGRLGLVVPDPSSLVPVDAFGRLIASMGRDSQPPWLPPDRLVSVDQMVAAADASQRPLADVAAELTRLGYDVPSLPEDIDTARADAKIFLLHDWRDRARPIDAQAIASHVNLPVADVEARVHAYGFTLTARTPAGEDRLLQARDLDSRAPWLTPRQAITPRFLADAARRVGRPVDDLRAYYLAAGFTVTDDTDDDVLLSRGLNRTRPYLDHTTPVPLTHVCAAAIRLRWPLAATAERLHQLGYHCAPASSTPSPQPGEWGFAQRHHEPWPVGVICGPRVIKTARGRALGIADQAAELGWPLVGAVPELSDKLERRLASAYDIRQALGRVTILSLASCFTMTSETVVRRLAQLGFVVVPGEAPLPRRVDKPLRVLLGDQLQLPPPEHDERLPARFVLAGALKLGIELREATRILTEAGVRFTDPLDILPVERPGDAPRWDEW